MCCWRIMEKIRWTNCVGYEEVLQNVKKERNILQTIKSRKNEKIDNYLRRNCLLKHVIGENIRKARSDGETRKKTY
jgi:hypothetical protein